MRDQSPEVSARRPDDEAQTPDRRAEWPVAVLHIGDRQTVVRSWGGEQGERSVVLAIGSQRTATEFFRHGIPTPLELEHAIVTVEDEIARARTIPVEGARLWSDDATAGTIVRAAGLPDQPGQTLSLELVEKTFDRLVAVAQGRPAAYEGLPDGAAFAATLLILREFMHHMGFASLTIRND